MRKPLVVGTRKSMEIKLMRQLINILQILYQQQYLRILCVGFRAFRDDFGQPAYPGVDLVSPSTFDFIVGDSALLFPRGAR